MFSKWPEVFGDSVVTNAIIDRLVHHAHIIKVKGQSYRVKDKKTHMQNNIGKDD